MDYLAYWHLEREQTAPRSAPASAPAPSSVPIRVVGGQETPAIRQAAEAYHSQHTVGNWARRTGSDPAKIRALLKGD